MRSRVGQLCVAVLLVCTGSLTVVGSVGAQAGDDPGDDLTVVAFEVEPFVERTGDVPGGFMFEIWEQIASERGWTYEVVWIETLDDLADLVAAGGADVAIAPLSSTGEREERFDFSSAVVASGPTIGVHRRAERPVTLLGALFSADILQLLLWSAVGLLLLGHLMWFVERRRPDSDFAPSYVRGVWDGAWWATVTVTTVGYGDTSPRTGWGRAVAILAMLGSLFLVGAFVSEVTTALQTERASSVASEVDDLEGRRVAVLEASSFETFLDERGVDTVGYRTQTEAFEAVERGDVDIVVADEYTLDALGREYGIGSTRQPLYDEFIAYAVPQGSPLRDEITGTLADLQRRGLVREIVERWTD